MDSGDSNGSYEDLFISTLMTGIWSKVCTRCSHLQLRHQEVTTLDEEGPDNADTSQEAD